MVENDDKLYDYLKSAYPDLFDGFLLSFDCGRGWRSLIIQICERIKGTGAKIHQVKEKYGGLRFYTDGETLSDSKFIASIENESLKVCENCGTRESVTTEGGWVKTLCKACRDS